LTELLFYVPLDIKQVTLETFPSANLLAWYEKTKPNITKARIHISKEMCYNTKQTQKKLKPGLVANNIYIVLKPKIESRVHYAPEPAGGKLVGKASYTV